MMDKYYIETPAAGHGEPFVCIAPTVAGAIATLWCVRCNDPSTITGDDPGICTSYLVHHGRAAEAIEMSAAGAYWLLSQPTYSSFILGWIKKHVCPNDFEAFTQRILDHAPAEYR